MQTQLMMNILHQNPNSVILKRGEDYEIHKAKGVGTESEYIEMWGYLDNGYTYLFRTPIESIRESILITGKFLTYVGTWIILLLSCGDMVFFPKDYRADPGTGAAFQEDGRSGFWCEIYKGR